MVRNIVAVVVAFLVGGLCVFGLESLGHRIYPLPEGIDTSNMEQIANYVKTAPMGAIAFVLLAQSAGSFVGGLVTGLLSRSHQTLVAAIYGVLGLIMAGLNLVLIPHPLWFMVLSVLLPIPLALAGSQLGQALRGGSAPAAAQ